MVLRLKNENFAGTPELLYAQAQLYADILMTCIAAPTCKSFEVGLCIIDHESCIQNHGFCIQNDGFCISNVQSWGFTDKDTWIGEASHPLPFDENYKPKPAVPAMINAMLAA